MSIFKKASDLSGLPNAVENAFFKDDVKVSSHDEFAELMEEASANRTAYSNRVDQFVKNKPQESPFSKPEPALYSQSGIGGIQRADYGQRFAGEKSNLFVSDQIRQASKLTNNKELSIWDPEFDVLQEELDKTMKVSSAKYDREEMIAKKSIKPWEKEQIQQIRSSNVLPYRGLGITRTGNETPLHHGDFGSVNEFYAEAQDNIRNMIKESNRDRKSMIERQGFAPEETLNDKTSIEARTKESMENTSFLAKFAESIIEDA